MPNFSGKWNLDGQLRGIKQGTWTGITQIELYVWGDNYFGTLGDNTTVNKSSPVQVDSLNNWSQVAAGRYHTIAIKTNGTLWAWGRNQGRLGDGTTAYRSSPVQIGALTNWDQASAGEGHTTAVKTDGTLWAWGFGSNGRLGDSTTVNKSSPVQIGSLTTWSQVAAGGDHTAAITTSGELYTWGKNSDGRIGDNTTTYRSSPVQVGALTTWSKISTGGSHTMGISGGELYIWGNDGSGRLGLNTVYVDQSSPVQIGALTTWSQVSAGGAHSGAIKTDGTLWMWGNGGGGRLGNTISQTIDVSSPVQIGSPTNWSQVSTSQTDHTIAVTTEGELYAWGNNIKGQLGLNDAIRRSSPVQVGALTSWSQVSAGAATAAISSSRTGMS